MSFATKSKTDSLPTRNSHNLHERLREDARFNPPTPSMWKRFALLTLVLFLFWLAFRIRPKEPQIIYADRYSREHKYRPAASPIITERLKDGRIRIRGAL